MAKFYIADMHLGHKSCLQFDNRPFSSIEEMDEALIDNWNACVTKNDTVYILGDFIWKSEDDYISYTKRLHGQKILIVGNHDHINRYTPQVRKCFQDIRTYYETTDSRKHIIMSHYPMPFHKKDYLKECYMLYGHVHCSHEYDRLKIIRANIKASHTKPHHACGNFINVGCMLPYMNYTPRTLDEIIVGDKMYENM